jgi:hypothetical protein
VSQDPGTDVCTNITANTSVEGISLTQSAAAQQSLDGWSTAAESACLLGRAGIAALASQVPDRGATMVNPVRALRGE